MFQIVNYYDDPKRWKDWVTEEYKAYSIYYDEIHRKRPPGYPISDRPLNDGIFSFKEVVFNPPAPNIWIVFNEEIAMTILSEEGIPLVVHMGISRSFRYLLKSLRSPDEFPLHKNLAIQLHSSAAYEMLKRQKIYMITRPVTTVREILLRYLTLGKTVFVDTNYNVALLKTSESPKLKTKVREIIMKIRKMQNKDEQGDDDALIIEQLRKEKQQLQDADVKRQQLEAYEMSKTMPFLSPVEETPTSEFWVKRPDGTVVYHNKTFNNWLQGHHMVIRDIPLVVVDLEALAGLYHSPTAINYLVPFNY